MPSYKKAKGSKGISNPKGMPASTKKSSAPSIDYQGKVDSRPDNSDRKQSAR